MLIRHSIVSSIYAIESTLNQPTDQIVRLKEPGKHASDKSQNFFRPWRDLGDDIVRDVAEDGADGVFDAHQLRLNTVAEVVTYRLSAIDG